MILGLESPGNEHGNCFAVTEEWRDDLHQTSYAYAAIAMEDSGEAEVTDEEKDEGLQHEWLALDVAIEKMKGCQPTSQLESIKERESFLMETWASRGQRRTLSRHQEDLPSYLYRIRASTESIVITNFQ